MKRFFSTFFTVVLVLAIFLGIAYAIDQSRMSSGKPVMFFTWGADYAPSEEAEPVIADVTEVQEEELTQKEENPVTATLYFPDMNIMYLCGEERVFENSDGIAKAVAEGVIAGPESDELLPGITDDVKVLSASVDKDSSTCVIDLSSEFAEKNTGGTTIEMMAIYSIVNSLCSLPGVENVKINIEGDENAFFGHFDISEPIEPDKTIVK